MSPTVSEILRLTKMHLALCIGEKITIFSARYDTATHSHSRMVLNNLSNMHTSNPNREWQYYYHVLEDLPTMRMNIELDAHIAHDETLRRRRKSIVGVFYIFERSNDSQITAISFIRAPLIVRRECSSATASETRFSQMIGWGMKIYFI